MSTMCEDFMSARDENL